jgi:hypothetical protein
MPTDLTREEREAMRARCEAATPGPWRALREGNWRLDDGTLAGASRVDELPVVSSQGIRIVSRFADADADFIAAARGDVPRLLDALDTAEAWQDVLLYWLLRVHVASLREGWEEGPSEEETEGAISDVLANADCPPESERALALLAGPARYHPDHWQAQPTAAAKGARQGREALEERVRVAEDREALRKYGRHVEGCGTSWTCGEECNVPTHKHCTCGFAAALEGR